MIVYTGEEGRRRHAIGHNVEVAQPALTAAICAERDGPGCPGADYAPSVFPYENPFCRPGSCGCPGEPRGRHLRAGVEAGGGCRARRALAAQRVLAGPVRGSSPEVQRGRITLVRSTSGRASPIASH